MRTEGVYTIEEDVSGELEKTSTLFILGVTPSDAGTYVCVAENIDNEVMDVAILMVHGMLTLIAFTIITLFH